MIKRLAIFLGILLAFAVMAIFAFRSYTKSFSPEEAVVLDEDNLKIEVEYSRPKKNERVIFGELVPYGEVWRTGANEATIFETNQDLIVKGQRLPAGRYSLWTIPGKEKWKVIWNSETDQWGVSWDGEANRKPSNDVLEIETPVIGSSRTFEQFTIDLDKVYDDIHLVMMWDDVMIVVPMTVK